MIRLDFAPPGRCCPQPTRPQARPLAAHRLPGHTAQFRAGDNYGMATESAIELVNQTSARRSGNP